MKVDPLKEIMNRVAYPTGTVIEFHLRRRLRRDPKMVLLEDPKRYYDALLEIFRGEEEAVIWLIKTALEVASSKTGLYIDPLEFIEALRTGDKEVVRKRLSALAKALLRGDGELEEREMGLTKSAAGAA